MNSKCWNTKDNGGLTSRTIPEKNCGNKTEGEKGRRARTGTRCGKSVPGARLRKNGKNNKILALGGKERDKRRSQGKIQLNSPLKKTAAMQRGKKGGEEKAGENGGQKIDLKAPGGTKKKKKKFSNKEGGKRKKNWGPGEIVCDGGGGKVKVRFKTQGHERALVRTQTEGT